MPLPDKPDDKKEQTNMTKTYGVFIGSKWGITNNKRVALRAVIRAGHGEVRAMERTNSRLDWSSFCIRSQRIFSMEQPAAK